MKFLARSGFRARNTPPIAFDQNSDLQLPVVSVIACGC